MANFNLNNLGASLQAMRTQLKHLTRDARDATSFDCVPLRPFDRRAHGFIAKQALKGLVHDLDFVARQLDLIHDRLIIAQIELIELKTDERPSH